MSSAVLYGFWLSSCSWRVRAALHLKRIPFEEKSVDIAKKKMHLTDQYKSINPSQKVPTLIIDGATLVESMAILQYLEDTRPQPSLTPNSPLLKCKMREICETIVSGIQPLQNIGLRPYFETEEKYSLFCNRLTERGLQTLEELLSATAGKHCVEDQLSMADLCLVPQIYNAVTRLGLDISKYKTVSRLYASLLKEDVFESTHPHKVKEQWKLRNASVK